MRDQTLIHLIGLGKTTPIAHIERDNRLPGWWMLGNLGLGLHHGALVVSGVNAGTPVLEQK